MQLDFTDFLYAMSFALDAVEHEFTGATAEHGKICTQKFDVKEIIRGKMT